MALITKTTAKSKYRIKDNQLIGLKCINRPNPHYKNGAPMQLFSEKEIKEFVFRHPRKQKKKYNYIKDRESLTERLVAEALYVVNKKVKDYGDKGHRFEHKKMNFIT